MADAAIIKAQARERVGKGAARATRREGRVPAVIYGDKQPPKPISLTYAEVDQHIQTGKFLSTLFTVDVDGEQNRVIPKDVQFDPVRDFPIHVDFLRLGKDAKIAVDVPVNFINEEEAPGLKQGGVLNVVRYTIEMICPADNIPQSVTADLTGLDLGGSLHISNIPLPDDIELTIKDRDFTVATIAVPAAVKTAEEVEAEAAALAEEEALAALEAGEEGAEAAPAGEAEGDGPEQTGGGED
jgi:large subunit ribosomal protein L25